MLRNVSQSWPPFPPRLPFLLTGDVWKPSEPSSEVILYVCSYAVYTGLKLCADLHCTLDLCSWKAQGLIQAFSWTHVQRNIWINTAIKLYICSLYLEHNICISTCVPVVKSRQTKSVMFCSLLHTFPMKQSLFVRWTPRSIEVLFSLPFPLLVVFFPLFPVFT